jgi:tetratricopeptide (TPR) repeat protein
MFTKKIIFAVASLLFVDLMLFVPKASCFTPTTESIALEKYAVITSTTFTATAQTAEAPSAVTFTDALYKAWIRNGGAINNIKPVVDELNTIKINNGFINLYPYSLVLLDEYRNLHSDKFLDYAILLSPSMPEPYFELSYSLLTGLKSNYTLTVLNLWKAVTSFFDDPYNILRFASNRLINITLSMLIVLFIFSLLLIIRYYAQIYGSLKSHLPEYIPAYAILVFSIVVIILPFLFGIGFLWLLVLWLAVTFTYQKLTERMVSAGFIIFLGLLPFISLVIIATIVKPGEEPFTGIMNINYGNVSAKDINALKTYADAHPGDLYSNLYMGVYNKRVGDYAEASLYYTRLQDNGYGNLPAVLCNIGNLEYATGDADGAENNYKKTISADPGFFPARYNLGQLYLIKGNIDGTNELDIAKGISPAQFVYYASLYQKSNLNRIFIDALPSPRELAYTMFKDTFHNSTEIGMADIMVSRLIKWPSAKQLPYLALWLLLLFMGVVFLSKFVKKHFRCKSCGRLYEPLSRSDEYREMICSDCLKFYIKNDIKDNKKKIEITQRVYRWKKRLKIINIASSILIPGSGSILRGQTIRGMLMLSIVCYLSVEYITSFGLITSIFPMFNPYTGILKSTTVFFLILVYLSNILFAIKAEVKWY